MYMILMEIKKIRMRLLFATIPILFFVSCRNETQKIGGSRILEDSSIDICKDAFPKKNASNFVNILNLIDEKIDSNLVTNFNNDLIYRVIFTVKDRPSYVIKYYQKKDIGLIKVKYFPTQELSLFRYCMDAQIEYTCKNIRVSKNNIGLVRSKFEKLKKIIDFNQRKIDEVSFEVVENGQYKYGIAKENLDSVRMIIDSIIQNNR
jgi:hypothetical protein